MTEKVKAELKSTLYTQLCSTPKRSRTMKITSHQSVSMHQCASFLHGKQCPIEGSAMFISPFITNTDIKK